MTYPYASGTDVGRRRDHNEDALFAEPPVFAVADGVGGSARGEVASSTALEEFAPLAGNVSHARSADDAVLAMEHAVLAANTAVHRAQLANDQLQGMATTLTAAVVRSGGELVVGHVGDSRLYVVGPAGARHITEDHSVVAELVRTGRLDAHEAPHHPQRNVITRALGTDGDVSVDAFTAHVGPGDWLLVCSDGLTEHVTDDELAHVVLDATRGGTATDAVTALIDLANERGGTDNITVVLAQPVPSDVSGELSLESIRAAGAMTTPIPVVSDAPAERSGPLPAITEPADVEASGELPALELMSSTVDDSPADEDGTRHARLSRVRARAWALGILVILLAVVITGIAWSQSYFLVARTDGTVGINRGFPVWRLSVPHKGSDLAVSAVDDSDRSRYLDSHTIRSRADAEKLLGQLEQQAIASTTDGSPIGGNASST